MLHHRKSSKYYPTPRLYVYFGHYLFMRKHSGGEQKKSFSPMFVLYTATSNDLVLGQKKKRRKKNPPLHLNNNSRRSRKKKKISQKSYRIIAIAQKSNNPGRCFYYSARAMKFIGTKNASLNA